VLVQHKNLFINEVVDGLLGKLDAVAQFSDG